MTNCANEPGGLGSILSEARFVFFFSILFFFFFFCFVFFRYFLFSIGFFSFLAVSPCYMRFGDLCIFSLPVTTYMGKQDGSRFRQIARKIRTGKFYSGIVFPICTKKRPREPGTGIKDGTWISIWSILFRPAKIGLPNIPFPCSISFSTGFSGNFLNGEQPLHLIIHCDEVRAIRTSNIRLFWNFFAMNFGICLLNNSSMVEIQNKPLK